MPPPAQNTGILKDDIIIAMDFESVKSVEVLNELLNSLPKNHSLAVRVIRDGSSLFFPFVLE